MSHAGLDNPKRMALISRRMRMTVAIVQRIGRGEIDHAAKILARYEQIDGPREVRFVDPGNELRSRALAPSQAKADQRQEPIEHSAAIGTQRQRAAGGDFARDRRGSGEEGLFPPFGDIDRKFQVLGAPGSLSPNSPSASLMARSRACR